MTPFKLATLDLLRRRTSTIIAILSIAISVACGGMLLRINNLSESRFSSLGRGGDAIVGAKAGGIEILLSALNGEGEAPGYLPLRLFESLRSGQEVRFEDGTRSSSAFIQSIIPFVYFAKVGDFRVVGTDETFLNRPRAEDSLSLSQGKWADGLGEVVLGASIAAKLKIETGSPLEAKLWESGAGGRSVHLRVVGVLNPTSSAWDRMLFSNLPTAQQALSQSGRGLNSIWGAEVLNYFLVYLQPNGFKDLASLVNQRTVGQAVLVPEQIERLRALTGTGATVGIFVTTLILSLAGLSVAALLITRFEAMSIQIAMLRAIGYKRAELGKWLLWEGFLMGLAACLVGAAMDAAGFPVLRHLLADSLPPADIVSSSVFESAPIWAIALAATSASILVPLFRVFTQDVHFSLRGQ